MTVAEILWMVGIAVLAVAFVVGILATDKVTCPGCWGTGSDGIHMAASRPCELCGGTGLRPPDAVPTASENEPATPSTYPQEDR